MLCVLLFTMTGLICACKFIGQKREKYIVFFFIIIIFLTFPSSLSSRAKTPVLSVNSFTLTAGNGWVVVKSPWVPQLNIHRHRMREVHGIIDDVALAGRVALTKQANVT